MDSSPRPFEQGRSFASQFTARRMNEMQDRVPRIKFSGRGSRVSHIGNQVFVNVPRQLPQAASAPPKHALLVYDVSAGGPDGLISVVAGSVTDLTNSGTVWTGVSGNIIYISDPVNGNVPFAVATGTPLVYPRLLLNSAATVVYLNATVDDSTGFITAMEIDGDTGGGLPPSTSTNWYYLLSSVTVTIVSSVATVKVFNDGAQSSLNFRVCESLPLVDGSGYSAGT